MRTLFIEEEELSIEVVYYHNLLGELVVHSVKSLQANYTRYHHKDWFEYTKKVLEQHIDALESNKLEANKS